MVSTRSAANLCSSHKTTFASWPWTANSPLLPLLVCPLCDTSGPKDVRRWHAKPVSDIFNGAHRQWRGSRNWIARVLEIGRFCIVKLLVRSRNISCRCDLNEAGGSYRGDIESIEEATERGDGDRVSAKKIVRRGHKARQGTCIIY